MSFAILRLQKLKTIGNIGGSLSHNYRTRNTPNADPSRTADNEHTLHSADAVKVAIESRLPEKRRKDAVLCIEHLITASPDWNGWGTDKEAAFFEKSKKWLIDKYGAENVIATSIHRDETTPHLVAYVVPIDTTGRLNAKKYIGGTRHVLSQMQTDFAATVADLGLSRGLEGSTAEHTTIKKYYSELDNKKSADEVNMEKHLKIYQRFAEDAAQIEKWTRGLDPADPKKMAQRVREISVLADAIANDATLLTMNIERQLRQSKYTKPIISTPVPHNGRNYDF
jgi:hypothetical protein